MRGFRLTLLLLKRLLLKRPGSVILRYGRPILKSEVLGRGLTVCLLLYFFFFLNFLAFLNLEKIYEAGDFFR